MMTQNVDAMAGSLVNQGLLVENSKKTPSSEQLVHEQIQVADVSMDELVIIDLGGKEATTSYLFLVYLHAHLCDHSVCEPKYILPEVSMEET
ncbi:hypothetical protein V6N13_126468 [Hibiscus sabdariffa]